MSDLNVGIVGLGWVAGAHIDAFKSVNGANVTAVCSRRQLDESQLALQYGTPLKAYQDLDDMLGDPPSISSTSALPIPFTPNNRSRQPRPGNISSSRNRSP